MATQYPGRNTLKTILQLVRYDIPVLIVGKSSIGKSYTIIELTKKWKITNSLLYIGSEKVENIEGLAKLISSDYESGEAGSDILKFLKPYWFPNTKTITEQVARGRKIFENYAQNYYDKVSFQYSYDILHQILLSLMDVNYEENSTEVIVKLTDKGDNNLSKVTKPETLNSKPFTFKRTLDTVIQVETANEGTLPPTEAGVDELKEMCMYLCTILGYGNYWLILDELDKVDEYSQDKYAPLLHIVRERTLKNWTMKEINDKEGLNLPQSIVKEDYLSVIELVNGSIDRGLPVLDTRIIGISNATIDIEEALFRRFCQIVMEDVMSLADSKVPEVNSIKNCIKENVGESQMDLTELLPKIGVLDEVNLQWQYSFLPKMFNQTDKFGNFFYEDFQKYYNKILSENFGNVENTWNSISGDGNLFSDVALGKIWKDNFLLDKDLTNASDAMKDLYAGLYQLLPCLLEKEFNPGAIRNDIGVAGFEETGGGTMSEIEQERKLMEDEFSELGEEGFFFQLKDDLTNEYNEAKGNPSAITQWTNSVLRKIDTANINDKGDYDQIPGIGDKIIPVLYQLMFNLYSKDDSLDSDLFTRQTKLINDSFNVLLNKNGDKGVHPLKNDKKYVESAMYGTELSKLKGMSEKKQQAVSGLGLYGTPGNYIKSISFNNYVKKYFYNELLYFFSTTLSNLQKATEFMDKSKVANSEENYVVNFLRAEPIKSLVRKYYDTLLQGPQGRTMGVRFLRDIMQFEK